MLGSFEDDLAFLAATELHPALHAAGFCRLIDLVDAAEMRQLWGSCSRSHAHFAAKVGGWGLAWCFGVLWCALLRVAALLLLPWLGLLGA